MIITLLHSVLYLVRYELNLSNGNLFERFLPQEELVSGRLFTTRMPRQLPSTLLATNESVPSLSAENFKLKCKFNNLSSVVILTQEEEYMKYAGGDLEAFYRSIPLEIITRPITDFSIPTLDRLVITVKVK